MAEGAAVDQSAAVSVERKNLRNVCEEEAGKLSGLLPPRCLRTTSGPFPLLSSAAEPGVGVASWCGHNKLYIRELFIDMTLENTGIMDEMQRVDD